MNHSLIKFARKLPVSGKIGLALVSFWIVIAFIGPLLAPYSPGAFVSMEVFADSSGDFWLGSDFWPHGDVSRLYGVFREAEPLNGACERAIFVVDKSGKIRFTRTYALDQLPSLEETFAALRELAKT